MNLALQVPNDTNDFQTFCRILSPETIDVPEAKRNTFAWIRGVEGREIPDRLYRGYLIYFLTDFAALEALRETPDALGVTITESGRRRFSNQQQPYVKMTLVGNSFEVELVFDKETDLVLDVYVFGYSVRNTLGQELDNRNFGNQGARTVIRRLREDIVDFFGSQFSNGCP